METSTTDFLQKIIKDKEKESNIMQIRSLDMKEPGIKTKNTEMAQYSSKTATNLKESGLMTGERAKQSTLKKTGPTF